MSQESCNDPLVSVVIPMYQAEAWIQETLATVNAQTYSRVETIVVDDGSTDGGADLVAKLAESSSLPVRLLRTENQGVSSARNAGVLASTGEYVALLDADDLWCPNKLELQVACLEGTSAAACVSGYELFDNGTGRTVGVVSFRPGSKSIRGWLALEGNGLLLPSTAMIRRTVLNEMRGFDATLSVSADLDFALRLEAFGKVLTLSETLVGYRLHGAQMHRRLGDLGYDMSQLHDRVFSSGNGGSFERRCRANLDAYLGYSHLMRGRIGTALPFLVSSLRRDPRRLVSLPVRAVIRRLARRFRALVRARVRWSDR
ncbi:MAG: glycosyltransferase family 2 protein [Proteobacteria bacterium]|nr:glycosyltransferase family 2 protein [Pseudomonadota bacterium]